MQKSKFNLLLVAITIAFLGSVSSFAQQPISTEKKSLISEFRVLTGANNVDGSINFSPDSVQQVFTSIIEQEKDLVEEQRVELRKSAVEATARIYKMGQDAVADKAEIIELSEKVIYQIYDKAFTESELKELVGFYRTATGQKASRFLRGLSSQVQKEFGEVIQVKLNNVLQPAIQIEIEKLKQKIKEAKGKKEAN
jgi:uncharacterized protein